MPQHMEIRLTSSLLGVLSILWACIMLYPTGGFVDLFDKVNDGIQNWLAWGLALHGAASIVGSVRPYRRLRHYSLVLGTICWFSLFGVFLQLWVLTPLTFLTIVFGAFTGLTLWCDVLRKPRDECLHT